VAFAVSPFNVIVPLLPPHVLGLVAEVPDITGVGGFDNVMAPTAAEVQPFIVTVIFEYVPAPRLVKTTVPVAFAMTDTVCGVPEV
jgi:hypothetical protein